MKILITVLNFSNLTGSELYVYDLARELVKKGHDVTIGRLNGGEGEIVSRITKLGVKIINLLDAKDEYDIIHCNQTQTTEIASKMFTYPIVQTLHSEVIDKYEAPFLSSNVKHYICIRQKIFDKYKDIKNKSLVYNGVDETRFVESPLPIGKTKYLFIGTKDYLREKSALDLVVGLKKGETVTFMGQGWEVGSKVKHPQVRFIGSRWDIENEIKKVNVVAGVMMGRATIEGWMMGRKGLIYDIDSQGNIVSKAMCTRPKDYKKFKGSFMVDKILEIYERVLHG